MKKLLILCILAISMFSTISYAENDDLNTVKKGSEYLYLKWKQGAEEGLKSYFSKDYRLCVSFSKADPLYPKHKEVLEKRITSTKGLKKVANALFDKYIVEYSKDEYFETSISLFAEPEEVRFLCEYRGFAADFRKYLEKFVPESSKLR